MSVCVAQNGIILDWGNVTGRVKCVFEKYGKRLRLEDKTKNNNWVKSGGRKQI